MTRKQIQYLDILRDEPVKLCHWLGFTKMTDLHNTWIRDMVFGKSDETLLAHRNSFKTTAVSASMLIDMILSPNTTTLFLRKTDPDVVEIIEQVRKMLTSPVTQHFIEAIYGVPLRLIKSNAKEITTNLVTRASGTVQLKGAGIVSGLTGKHFDRIRTDDIVTLKDRISRAEREYSKTIYMELQNIINDGGRIYNTGTPWHKEDAISSMMPNVKRFDCYSAGILTRDDIEAKRNSMTPSLFAANYELKHIVDGDALFTNPRFTKDITRIYNGIGHIDAAYGGKDGVAFTALSASGDSLVMFGKMWRKGRHVDDCLAEIYALAAKYRVGTIHMEDNADKGYLRKKIKKVHPVKGYDESTNKFIKISTHLRGSWKWIEWLEDSDPEYINEILDYTENAEFDDCPDSASSLIRTTKRQGFVTV